MSEVKINVFRKEYRKLDESTLKRMEQIKDDAQKLWDSFDWAQNEDKRMMALAKTNLEQAVMWAIKAIT